MDVVTNEERKGTLYKLFIELLLLPRWEIHICLFLQPDLPCRSASFGFSGLLPFPTFQNRWIKLLIKPRENSRSFVAARLGNCIFYSFNSLYEKIEYAVIGKERCDLVGDLQLHWGVGSIWPGSFSKRIESILHVYRKLGKCGILWFEKIIEKFDSAMNFILSGLVFLFFLYIYTFILCPIRLILYPKVITIEGRLSVPSFPCATFQFCDSLVHHSVSSFQDVAFRERFFLRSVLLFFFI